MTAGSVLALAGGVGGAKLASGLNVLCGEELAVIVNTADDFEHLGLSISPDLDSVMYALAGLNDTERGWGLANETWTFMKRLKNLGAEDWFNLGDGDLATHVVRTKRLRDGDDLFAVTDRLRRALGIAARLLPMSNDPVRTIVCTPEGDIAFQDYFVARQCRPEVRSLRFEGIAKAGPAPQVRQALQAPGLAAILFCPSNPHVSIGPILALRGVTGLIREARCPRIAVSPLVGGAALKGPAAQMMASLGYRPDALGVAQLYAGLIDGIVIDEADRSLKNPIADLGLSVHVTQTVMKSAADRLALAEDCLAFAAQLATGREEPVP